MKHPHHHLVTPAYDLSDRITSTRRIGIRSVLLLGAIIGFVDVSAAQDDCATATAVAVGMTPWGAGATAGLDPTCEGSEDEDLWFAWTAPADGDYLIDTCSTDTSLGGENDTVLTVYASCADAAAGSCIATGDDECVGPGGGSAFLSSTTLTGVTAGDSFLIRVSDWAPGADADPLDPGVLNIVGTAPANDDCAGATAIAGLGSFPFDNTLATTDGVPDPLCLASGSDQIENDVWFAWIAPANEFYVVETCGLTTVDTRIAVYESATCPPGPAVACNDNSCGLQSLTGFGAVAGQSYLIRVGNSVGANPGQGTVAISSQGAVQKGYCTATSTLTAMQMIDDYHLKFNGRVGGVKVTTAPATAGTPRVDVTNDTTTSMATIDWNGEDVAGSTIGIVYETGNGTTLADAYWTLDGMDVGSAVSDTNCSGGPQIGSQYCSTTINSSGNAAEVQVLGDPSVSANNLTQFAEGCPPNVFGLFFLGVNQTMLPFGDGFRCVNAPVFRGQVGQVDPLGFRLQSLDLTVSPGNNITPGSTWNFQFWFRDSAAGMSGFNLSDAVSVDFIP